MRYEIEAGGRVRLVSVRRAGDGFAVSVDGRLHQVDVARIDAHTLSLIVDNRPASGAAGPAGAASRAEEGGPDPVRPAVYDVTVAPGGAGRLTVAVGAVRVAVAFEGRRPGRRESGELPGSGPLRIVAPMPGKIVRVLVGPGESVRARQPVVVVEAMKMENELRAGRDGIVGEVHAREGSSVEAGTLLIVIQ